MAKRPYAFLISDRLNTGLKALKKKTGMPEGEAIRRALEIYLVRQGALKRQKGR